MPLPFFCAKATSHPLLDVTGKFELSDNSFLFDSNVGAPMFYAILHYFYSMYLQQYLLIIVFSQNAVTYCTMEN